MAVGKTSTRLGCGRDMDDVWADIDRPPSAHERDCPFCRQARADLSPLAHRTREQRRADLEDPELQPDPQVLERILTVARAEVRRGRRLPLDEPDAAALVSPLTVSEQTVAAVVRRAGDGVPGVQIRRVRLELPPEVSAALTDAGTAELTVAGAGDGPGPDRTPARPARVSVSLQISVAATAPIPVVSEAVRAAVRGAVTVQVGMDPVRVDIVVEDVHDA